MLGAPEHACCACGGGIRATSPLTSPADQTEGKPLRQALFFATHVLDSVDSKLIRHLVHDLQPRPEARLFVLHFREQSNMSITELAALRTQATASDADVWLWNEDGLRHAFPRVASALANGTARGSFRGSSTRRQRTPRAFVRYHFFHASLSLWNLTFGHRWPSIEYFWRIEPDALFAGSLTDLLRLTSSVQKDVLLPSIVPKGPSNMAWPHWQRNADEFPDQPGALLHSSLVSFGRYSNRFLRDVMEVRWADGRLGYEEISLPTACARAAENKCSMDSFWRYKIHSAKRCLYRPIWNCSDFLQAREAETHELWHPVKDRRCVVEWLDRRAKGHNELLHVERLSSWAAEIRKAVQDEAST